MVLPVVTGKECMSKLSARQFSDFQFPPIDNWQDSKLNRVWSTVHSGFQETESKIKQCASLLYKNKVERNKIVTEKNEKPTNQTSTDFHLPSIFQGNAKKILNEERSLKEMVASKGDADSMEKSLSNLDFGIPRRQFIRKSNLKQPWKQEAHALPNNFCTIAVSWCGRNSRACYTRRELSDVFIAFGPVKNVRFLTPRYAEIEFLWLGSACLAVRAPRVRLPGKVTLHRQWADTSMQRQLWRQKNSHAK